MHILMLNIRYKGVVNVTLCFILVLSFYILIPKYHFPSLYDKRLISHKHGVYGLCTSNQSMKMVHFEKDVK